MIRAFVAIPLPEAVRQQLAVTQFMLPLPRRVMPENLHITLAFLGDVEEPALEELHMELSRIAMGPITLRFDRFGMFGGDKPRNLHMRIAPDPALEQLAHKVMQAARAAGITPEARRFMPHVTLGRFRPEAFDRPRMERALAEIGAVQAPPFTVDAFALYRSTLRPDGPVYDELARYPLQG